MATTPIDHNLLICQLCDSIFTSPKLLPCLHVFCRACVQNYIADVKIKRQNERRNVLALSVAQGSDEALADGVTHAHRTNEVTSRTSHDDDRSRSSTLDNEIPLQTYDDILPHDATAEFHRAGNAMETVQDDIYEEITTQHSAPSSPKPKPRHAASVVHTSGSVPEFRPLSEPIFPTRVTIARGNNHKDAVNGLRESFGPKYMAMNKSTASVQDADLVAAALAGSFSDVSSATLHSSREALSPGALDTSSERESRANLDQSRDAVYPDVIPHPGINALSSAEKRVSNLARNPTICGKASLMPGFMDRLSKAPKSPPGCFADVGGMNKLPSMLSVVSSSGYSSGYSQSMNQLPSMLSVVSSNSSGYSQSEADTSFVTAPSSSHTDLKLPTKASRSVVKQKSKSLGKKTKKTKKEHKRKHRAHHPPLMKPINRSDIVVLHDARIPAKPTEHAQCSPDPDEDDEYIYEMPVHVTRFRSDSEPLLNDSPTSPSLPPKRSIPNVYTDSSTIPRANAPNVISLPGRPLPVPNNVSSHAAQNVQHINMPQVSYVTSQSHSRSKSSSDTQVKNKHAPLLTYKPSKRVKSAMLHEKPSHYAPALRKSHVICDVDGYAYVKDKFQKLKLQTQEGVSDFVYDEVHKLETQDGGTGDDVFTERSRSESQCSGDSGYGNEYECPQCTSLFKLVNDSVDNLPDAPFISWLHDVHFQQCFNPKSCAKCNTHFDLESCEDCKFIICKFCKRTHACYVTVQDRMQKESANTEGNAADWTKENINASLPDSAHVSTDESDSQGNAVKEQLIETAKKKFLLNALSVDKPTETLYSNTSINTKETKTECACGKSSTGTTEQYYCYTCQIITCHDCFVTSHRHHACASVHDLSERARSYLHEYEQLCEDVGLVHEHETLQMDKHLSQYDCSKQKVLSDITYAYVRARQQMEEAYCELSRQVNFRYEEEMEHVRSLQAANRKFMERVTHARSFAKHVELYATQMEQIKLTGVLADNLLEMQALKPVKLETKLNVEFIPADTKPVEFMPHIGKAQRMFMPIRRRGVLPNEMQTQRERLLHAKQPLSLIRSFKPRTGADTRGCKPTGVTISQLGEIVVIDDINRKIKVFSELGQLEHEVEPKGERTLIDPWDITITSYGNYVVTDKGSKSVKIFDRDGDIVSEFGPHLSSPWGVCSSNNGDLLVTDTHYKSVFIHDNIGNLKFKVTAPNNLMVFPEYITSNINNDIIVSDFKGNSVHIMSSLGQYLFHIQSAIPNGKLFESPCGVACDHQGNILLADYENARVCEFTSGGQFISYVLTKGDHVRAPQCLVTNRKTKTRQARVILVDGTEVKIYKRNKNPRITSMAFSDDGSLDEPSDLELKPKAYKNPELRQGDGMKAALEPPEAPRPRRRLMPPVSPTKAQTSEFAVDGVQASEMGKRLSLDVTAIHQNEENDVNSDDPISHMMISNNKNDPKKLNTSLNGPKNLGFSLETSNTNGKDVEKDSSTTDKPTYVTRQNISKTITTTTTIIEQKQRPVPKPIKLPAKFTTESNRENNTTTPKPQPRKSMIGNSILTQDRTTSVKTKIEDIYSKDISTKKLDDEAKAKEENTPSRILESSYRTSPSNRSIRKPFINKIIQQLGMSEDGGDGGGEETQSSSSSSSPLLQPRRGTGDETKGKRVKFPGTLNEEGAAKDRHTVMAMNSQRRASSLSTCNRVRQTNSPRTVPNTSHKLNAELKPKLPPKP